MSPRRIPRDLIKHLEWSPGMGLPKPASTSSGGSSGSLPPTNSRLDSTIDYWSIPSVQYRGGIYIVDLAKSLLDGGNKKTQDEWIAYAKEAQPKDEFYTGDMPLQHAIFTATFQLEESAGKEEIRQFVKKHMFERWLMTTTRIYYQPQGSTEDIIVHNKGLDEYQSRENFVFPDEYVKDSTRPSNYKALLDVDNLEEINKVYQWLTEKNAYLWRNNSRTRNVEERVARFVAGSGRAWFYCDRNPSIRGASLGVRIKRA